MDNDDATIGRILTRRQALLATARAGLVLGGVAVLGRAARAATTAPATRPAALVAAPQMTEGPFFVDERLNRSDLVAGSTRPSVARGLPLALTVSVYKLAGTSAVPLPGATVDVWHADAHGIYSDEDDPMNPEVTTGQRWLRGYQVTDRAGRVAFGTIFPGWYDGRAPHVHFKVRQFAAASTTRPSGATAEFTSQWFFPDAVADAVYAHAPYNGRGDRGTLNADDGIYGERLADGSPAGAQMTLALRDNPAGPGRAAAFALYLTEASLHAGPHDGGGPGGPGGGPPPPLWDNGPFPG
jgi:protocatechuate 3,4-dioxygenase beta subunit